MSTFGRLTRAATRVVALGAACGLATLGVTACGTQEQAQSGGDTRVVEHAMGTTEITGEPTRVVTLDATFTSAVMALEEQVVGYATFGGRKELPKYLGKDRKTYGAKAEWVGTLSNPNLEKIVQLKPDLILSAKVRHEQLYEQLSEIAPTVFSQTTGGTWKQNLRLTGKALGKQELAEKTLAAYEKRAKTVGDNIRDAVGHNPTMSIVRFAGEPTVRLYTKKSFPGIVQSDTGLARPKGQPTGDGIAVNLSQERILELDAEHIFITVYPDKAGDAAETKRAFQSNPLWSKLSGEKHTVSDLTWMTSVGLHGAHVILDDLAATFGVDPAR
ncbi:ABC transporter substrate-binding protein [Haloactinomyces albus]|uniref:Iron complex transport system substrate-binding protein n=1 Tax=Haloactinomyces albus TaxID=1352928 RepID=A0AAE3ZD40_9ACTN|nr:iron-siderophore ABC transporter substrate-binding protein [Haloactinomyces albus]MDR7301680.1 iron complex transport system substrate-binding protein [Haloactinomyces albus]